MKSSPLRRALIRFIAFAVLGSSALPALAGQPPLAAEEYQLKAVFLFNFVQFVEWPSGAFDSPTSPVVIAIVGEDPFGADLDQIVQGEKVRGREIVVKRATRVEDIDRCHLLFINEPNAPRLKTILAQLAQRPVLTVGDAPDFSRYGGMIRFVMEDNRVRLRINVDAATAARLTLSSKLLRPAQIVTSGDQ